MDKTVQNIMANNNVSLVCWSGMMGYQIKGTVAYKTEGSEFDQAVTWVHGILPDRIVKGLIIMTPIEVFDIAPAKNTTEQLLHH